MNMNILGPNFPPISLPCELGLYLSEYGARRSRRHLRSSLSIRTLLPRIIIFLHHPHNNPNGIPQTKHSALTSRHFLCILAVSVFTECIRYKYTFARCTAFTHRRSPHHIHRHSITRCAPCRSRRFPARKLNFNRRDGYDRLCRSIAQILCGRRRITRTHSPCGGVG